MAVKPPPQSKAPRDMSEALAALVDKEWVNSRQHLDQQARANQTGAHAVIIDFTRLFIAKAGKAGIPLYAHNMVRTSAEQDALFSQGVSKARGGKSPHNFGLAVDIIHARRAWQLSPMEWELLFHMGQQLAAGRGWKLTCGIEWDDDRSDEVYNGWDPAHWELTNWKALRAQLKEGQLWPTISPAERKWSAPVPSTRKPL